MTTPSRRTADRQPQLDYSADWRDPDWRQKLRRRLLRWFHRNARTMPWRSDPTPYHVWVSEIMLQQTQVATVLPYYDRWMKAFPTVQDLAAADESELMKLWEGLGYYRRVRSMHAAAKQIVAEHDGKFPDSFEAVLSLPGIGRYTAGAVLSISQDKRLPVLEGNTQRVYSRWIALRQHPTEKPANGLLWEFAETMLPRKGSGTFNQAAMELGALVCTPKNPDCDHCPVLVQCHAAELGLQTEIPGKVTKTKYEDRTEFALLVRCTLPAGDAAFLARPLPDGARWAGLWDFPRPTDVETSSVEDAADWLGKELGATVRSGIRRLSLRHAVTKYRIVLHVHEAVCERAEPHWDPPAPWRWVTQTELDELPMSVTGRKIAQKLRSDDQPTLPGV